MLLGTVERRGAVGWDAISECGFWNSQEMSINETRITD
jgi:hypothetical protein